MWVSENRALADHERRESAHFSGLPPPSGRAQNRGVSHDALIALFRRIVLAGAPLLGGCSGGGYCPPDRERTAAVIPAPADAAPADGSIDDLLARCQASASDCTPLCERTLFGTRAPSGAIKQCQLVTADGGLAVHVVYTEYCIGGRRPEGLAAPTLAGSPDPLGAWLAGCAHLEAASIDAFEILAAELAAHRAPRPLIRAARAAAADERRHADVIGRLAARRGQATPAARVTRGAIRDIETIARENAVEGCTRETYAALVACRQARAATDPAIRAAMTGIARDETRHAALAWAVDGWSQALLGPAARRRVRDARREASDALLAEPPVTLSPALRAQAGLPDADEATRMLTVLHAQLPS